jgi:hypothetical protein
MKENMRFIPKEKWIPKSPEAAPMDYLVWGYLNRFIWKKKVKDMAVLKRALRAAWKNLPQEYINNALVA